MIAAEREHPEATEKIEVFLAVTVIKVLPAAPAKTDVVSDRPQQANHLGR